MTEKTMIQVIMQLSDAYPHKGDEVKPLLKLMADKLSRYPLKVVELAVDEHIATSKYFPAISEMMALCKRFHQSIGRYDTGTRVINFKQLRYDLLDSSCLDITGWEQLISTAKNLGYDDNVLYLEAKLKYIESYSWDVEKAKWQLAEMEAIAI